MSMCVCATESGVALEEQERDRMTEQRRGCEFSKNVLTRLSTSLYSCYVSISLRVLYICQRIIVVLCVLIPFGRLMKPN